MNRLPDPPTRMSRLPAPPAPRKKLTDDIRFWHAVGWFILIAGLFIYNWGGLWRWEFFGG